jgi:vacuolar-type H+-ATPase subunit E/Vma4
MALENLIRSLRQDAEREVAAVQAAAEAEAETIRSEAAADLAARRGALLAERETERQAGVELALVSARRQARGGVLAARGRLLERVLAEARRRFPEALPGSQFHALLPGWLEQALTCLAGRPGTLRAHPALGSAIRQLVAGRTDISVVEDPAVGAGFRLVSDDGALEIAATLEDRLARLDPRLRQEVLAALGPPS